MKPTEPRDRSEPVVADEAEQDTHDEAADPLVRDELLVEEISIDGMCGVY